MLLYVDRDHHWQKDLQTPHQPGQMAPLGYLVALPSLPLVAKWPPAWEA